MATEKYFVFSESGELKRMKGRIVRFLDNEDPTGSDKSAIRTSLEVSPDAAGLVQADVGTAPNEIPVNGMLGDMAYQSSDGVSAAKLEVESTTGTATTQALTVTDGSSTNFVVQEDGNVGIGNNSPSSYHPSADDLVVGDTSGHRGMTIVSGSGNSGSIYFADGTSGDALYRGYIGYNQGSNLLNFGTAATTQWQINNSGNLVAYAAGVGIDFGSAATSAGQGTGTTGTPANSVLSDYEFGSWTPTFLMSGSSNFAALTMDVVAAQYVKVGRHVHCQAYIRTDNVDTSGATGYVTISGLPFVSDATSGNNGGASIHNSARWTNAPTTGNVPPNTARLYLQRNGTTGVSTLTAADLVNGAAANQNEVVFTASYIAST